MARIEYTPRFLGPTYLERERNTALQLGVYYGGSIVAPASGTVSIYNAANVAVVSATPVTVTSSYATYTLSSATVAGQSYGSGWRVEWLLTMPDGYVHAYRNSAALVRMRLPPAATDADLYARHPDLAEYLPAGETSWQDQLDLAWLDIVGWLEGKGRRPYLVISEWSLKPWHEFETLAIICRLLSGSGSVDNKWTALAEHYDARAQAARESLTFEYDENDEGVGSTTKRTAASPTVWLTSRGGVSWG
jgi:hypothetical protein